MSEECPEASFTCSKWLSIIEEQSNNNRMSMRRARVNQTYHSTPPHRGSPWLIMYNVLNYSETLLQKSGNNMFPCARLQSIFLCEMSNIFKCRVHQFQICYVLFIDHQSRNRFQVWSTTEKGIANVKFFT